MKMQVLTGDVYLEDPVICHSKCFLVITSNGKHLSKPYMVRENSQTSYSQTDNTKTNKHSKFGDLETSEKQMCLLLLGVNSREASGKTLDESEIRKYFFKVKVKGSRKQRSNKCTKYNEFSRIISTKVLIQFLYDRTGKKILSKQV